jgi:uncharacterized membrane protein
MPKRPQNATLFIGALCLVAAGLRLWGLEVQSLWHDELFTWYASQLDGLAAAVDFGATQDVHPPGFVVFLYAWQRLFGDSEWVLRLPAALAGIAAIAWMYRLGRAWVSERVGRIAATLLTFSWPAIYYSQEARAYSFMLLLSVGMVERILHITQTMASGKKPSWVALSVLTSLAITLSYLHYFGLLFVVFCLVSWGVHLRYRRVSLTPWITVSGLSFLAYTPWISHVINQVDRGKTWIPAPSMERVIAVYQSLCNDHLFSTLALVGAGAVAGYLWAARHQNTRFGPWLRNALRSPLTWVLAWVTVPTLATLAISATVLPVLTDRNLIIMLPGVVLLVAIAVDSLERWTGRWPVFTVAIVSLLAADLFGTKDYYNTATKWQYRAVAESVVAQSNGMESVHFVTGAWHPSYFDYYFEQLDSPVRVSDSGRGRKQLKRKAERSSAPTVFVAAAAGKNAKRRGKLQLQGYTREEATAFIGWDLYRFKRN